MPFDQAGRPRWRAVSIGGNRRVRIAKLKRELGFQLLYPTYRDGLRAPDPQVRARADEHRSCWLRGYRGVMGLAYLTLVPVQAV